MKMEEASSVDWSSQAMIAGIMACCGISRERATSIVDRTVAFQEEFAELLFGRMRDLSGNHVQDEMTAHLLNCLLWKKSFAHQDPNTLKVFEKIVATVVAKPDSRMSHVRRGNSS